MNYKKIRHLFLTMLIFAFVFISCTNNDANIDINNSTEESTSLTTAMSVLNSRFNEDGSLNENDNPIGNVIFDFCFDFVYPITLSYNNGTEVTIENFDSLVDVLTNMTDNLYVNGIAFPFQVEVFNDGAIHLETISSEGQFVALLLSCNIDNDDNDECVCSQEYSPVCVEIENPNGETFVMEFPNMCYAECEGFTNDDLVSCEEDDYCIDDNEDCFEFVYPFEVTNLNGEVFEINDANEFENVLYSNYSIDFVFPFDVLVEVDGVVDTITIANEDMFADLLEDCTLIEDCEINNLTATVGDCLSQTTYSLVLDFDVNFEVDDPSELMFDLTLSSGFIYGTYSLADLPIDLNLVADDSETELILVTMINTNCTYDVIMNEVEFEVPDCFTGDDCSISDIAVTVGDCINDATYTVTLDFNTENPGNEFFDLFDANNYLIGYFQLENLPITLTIQQGTGFTDNFFKICINDNEDCCAEVDWSSPNCEGTFYCWEFVFPITIEQDGDTITIADQTAFDNQFTNDSELIYPFQITNENGTFIIYNPNDFEEDFGGLDNMCD